MNEPRWTDEEIYAAMAADPDFPEVTDADLRNAVAVDHLGNVRPLRHRSTPTDECSYCLQLRTDVRHDTILGYVCSRCERDISGPEQ